MTSYFYRDPLDAASMATRYGMRVQLVNAEGKLADVSLDTLCADAIARRRDHRYLVHADSLPLLRPQLGDLIERHDCFYFVVTVPEHTEAEAVPAFNNQTVSLESAKSWPNPEETFIRMRNGLPFVHPERETA